MLLLLVASTTVYAQEAGTITGLVRDETGKPVQAATISLQKAGDSSLVKNELSGKDGGYKFLKVQKGSYFITISIVGYNTGRTVVFQIDEDHKTIPDIALSVISKDLGAVVVTAKKPLIETKIDRTVVNVDASPSNAGSTAMEVLEKSPGIMVNSDGAISLRGKQGVIVMIDGKPTYLSATDLANMLKNMPASALDQIEIMTNPSSKYDASGNSGIINIKTKKGKADGFNGSVMVGVTSSIYHIDGVTSFIPKSQNSFTFNYRKGKINFFGNYNPNYFQGRNTQSLRRNFYDPATGAKAGSLDQDVRFKFGNENHSLKLGMDLFADAKNTFGVVLSGFAFSGHPKPVTVATSRDANGRVESSMVSNTDNHGVFKNFSANANYRHVFDSAGQELTVDLDYVAYKNLSDMMLTTLPYDQNGQAGLPIYLKGHLPSTIDIRSFKSDYTKPFKNGRFEAGLKSSFVKTDNIVDYQNQVQDKWYTDSRSNHFIYEENINAAYVNLNKQLKKWTLQGGLRMENTIATGKQVTTNTNFDRNNTSLFPSAFVSYDADKNNKLTVSYSRRITRPNYQNLNPFVFFLDSLTYQQGNPYLKPQYTNNMELSHSFKGKFITTLAYNNTTDVISQMIKQNTAEKKTFNTFENVAKLKNISLSVTAPFKVSKIWSGNFFGLVYNNHYTGIYNNSMIDVGATSFNANLTNTFTFNKGWTTELSGFYRFRSIEQLAVLEPFGQMSVAVQKQVIKGKGTLRLNIRDPFSWQHFYGHFRYDDVDLSFDNRQDVRQVTATFTYRFGKNTPQSQPKRKTGSSQEEQSRVGQGN